MNIAPDFKEALNALHAGRFEQARTALEALVEASPENPDYLHQLGITCAQLGQLPLAKTYLQKAIAQNPKVPPFHNHLGNVARALGDYETAERSYREALRLKPDYPEGLNNLGALHYRQGKTEEAIYIFQKSIRLDPSAIDAHYNLANAYIRDDQSLSALSHYRKVLELSPDHLGAHHNLGILLATMGKLADAKPHLRRALVADTRDLDAHFHYAMVLTAEGEKEKAKELYQQVLTQAPKHSHAHHNLATLHLADKETDKALEHYQKALALNPSNTTALHLIRSLTGEVATSAPEGYVRDLFDHYAPHYDEHVKAGLDYQVPYALRDLIRPYKTLDSDPWFAIDIGCGTGLCAPHFHDIIGRIVGIDLSERMIALAKKQGGYHRLHTGDMCHILDKEYPQRADLIIAADVFVYSGDLQKIFTACANALQPEGYFLFSIESCEQHPFTLQPSGRFAHHIDYIQSIAQDNGFKILECKEAHLREQESQSLHGMLLLLQKI